MFIFSIESIFILKMFYSNSTQCNYFFLNFSMRINLEIFNRVDVAFVMTIGESNFMIPYTINNETFKLSTKNILVETLFTFLCSKP